MIVVVLSSAVFLVVMALIVFLVFNTYFKQLKYRSYSGDRITGTFAIAVDGREYIPDVQMFEFENKGTQRLHIDIAGFSIKGGEYGPYKISFKLENKELYNLTGDSYFSSLTSDPILTYQYLNSNWWNVTEMQLTAEIIYENEEWVVYTKVVYREPSEIGIIIENTVEKSFTYEELVRGHGTITFGL
jgi:hypothetical protein